MRRISLAVAITLLLAFSPHSSLAQSQPTPPPSNPMQIPNNELQTPPCSDPAWGATDHIGVYTRRKDWPRVLAMEVQAARMQRDCATKFQNNHLGELNMLNSAASSFADAADLAFRLHLYGVAGAYASASTAEYQILLAKLPQAGSDYAMGFSVDDIHANITTNNDLLKRMPPSNKKPVKH